MELITQTSLEALLLKATNPQNQNIDNAAVEAFCALISKEKDGPHIGVKVIASRLPGGNEREMLQTLSILDTCMSRCGTPFQSEVGKFRFLNEMIKLVSPKYLGSQTPLAVKQEVLQLMYVWTLNYPKEMKIKEAYDMLRKQGVIREIPNTNISVSAPKRRVPNSVFHDEEKSKILRKLLQSKDPEDIQAANWLIKSMVKEDDKRAEMKSRHISELESVQNNVRLLNEMLDSYKPGISSPDELALIKELHQSCERLKPNLMALAAETQQTEEILDDVLQTNDELTQVFSKFSRTIHDEGNPLLDFDGPIHKNAPDCECTPEVDVLCDIFNASNNIPENAEILKPTAVVTCGDEKSKGLEDLDILSDHLFKENLQSTRQCTFKNQTKIPMNLLTKPAEPKTSSDTLNFDYLINKPKEEPKTIPDNGTDDFLVDLNDEPDSTREIQDVKLSEIFVNLEDIKPSELAPLSILNDGNGISITLHFAKGKLREDVNVFVVTTVSKNMSPIKDYSFHAVVPKGCKLKLQPPSDKTLPAFKPFLPPSAITQVMLISAPKDVQVNLKFSVSFVMDGETYTEMGEVDDLPFI